MLLQYYFSGNWCTKSVHLSNPMWFDMAAQVWWRVTSPDTVFSKETNYQRNKQERTSDCLDSSSIRL